MGCMGGKGSGGQASVGVGRTDLNALFGGTMTASRPNGAAPGHPDENLPASGQGEKRAARPQVLTGPASAWGHS
jgi:hypothetical protein